MLLLGPLKLLNKLLYSIDPMNITHCRQSKPSFVNWNFFFKSGSDIIFYFLPKSTHRLLLLRTYLTINWHWLNSHSGRCQDSIVSCSSSDNPMRPVISSLSLKLRPWQQSGRTERFKPMYFRCHCHNLLRQGLKVLPQCFLLKVLWF